MKTIIKKMISFVVVLFISFSLIGCFNVTNPSVTTEKQPKNLYDLAVEEGFEGTLDEWILSLFNTGEQKSVYEQAVEQGLFNGTLEEFIRNLKGETGNINIQEASSFAINSICSIYSKFTKTVVNWFGGPRDDEYMTAGSGVIIDDNKEGGIAYIVTNLHVIYDSTSKTGMAEKISVYLYGMEFTQYEIDAKFIGGSQTYDIAVLKIESDIYKNSGAYKATIGNSRNIVAGDTILAIGNPEAEGISVTSGIISVEDETIEITNPNNRTQDNFRVIRIDAAVNGGNSGGGIFNTYGELVGIVNAKEVNTEIEGMGYAIPSNIVSAIAKKIINSCDGETKTTTSVVTLGVEFEVSESKSEYNSEQKRTKIVQTISVSDIELLSVANGKLNKKDVIVNIKINNETIIVDHISVIEDTLLRLSKGDTIIFTILRNNEIKEISIVLNNEINLT